MPLLTHAAPGLVSKWIDPKLPLWASLLSVYLLDILIYIPIIMYMIFGGLNYDQASRTAVPLTHSLFMAAILSVITALITVLITYYHNSKKIEIKNKTSISRSFRTGLFIGLLVFSHWVVDFIGWPMSVGDPHATGLPLLFDMTQTVGLGVGSTWIGGITMEVGSFIVGLMIYIYYLIKHKKEKKLLNESNLSSKELEIEFQRVK
jgi:hypothetical protein